MTTCFTGAVLVFEEELQHSFHKERYFVNPISNRQPVDSLLTSLHQKVPGASISGIKIYTDSTRSTEIMYTVKNGNDKDPNIVANTQAKKPAAASKENRRLIAYIDPYTAGVIELYNHQDSFFYSMMSLHRWLLGGNTGKLVVGICTFIFLFILITGIILWWPKTKNILQQRLKVKWGSSWKRLTHDLHIVLGFYSAIFLFMFAFTGLAWSFQWFNKGIYTITSSSMQQPKAPVSTLRVKDELLSYHTVYKFIKAQVQDVNYYNIITPKDSLAPFSVNVLPLNAPHESAINTYFIDKHRALVLGTQNFSDRNLGQRVRSTFKPIHVASIFGVGSKIIGLIVCIFGVFFPLTGYIMWWLRTRKSAQSK